MADLKSVMQDDVNDLFLDTTEHADTIIFQNQDDTPVTTQAILVGFVTDPNINARGLEDEMTGIAYLASSHGVTFTTLFDIAGILYHVDREAGGIQDDQRGMVSVRLIHRRSRNRSDRRFETIG